MIESEDSKNQEPDVEALIQHLRTVFAAQYRRGSEDVLRHLTALAKTGPQFTEAHVQTKKRAPRGTAKILVERVLSTGAHTVKEICTAASSEAERLLSASAVRLELERGRQDKRYRNQGGKWLLKAGAR